MHLFFLLLSHSEISATLCSEDSQIVEHLIDLMHDKNPKLRHSINIYLQRIVDGLNEVKFDVLYSYFIGINAYIHTIIHIIFWRTTTNIGWSEYRRNDFVGTTRIGSAKFRAARCWIRWTRNNNSSTIRSTIITSFLTPNNCWTTRSSTNNQCLRKRLNLIECGN